MKNLKGCKFGRWTVIEYSGNSKWKCICNCDKHTIKDIRTYNLTSGHSKSCGCLQKEFIKQLNKKPFNKYEIDKSILKVFDKNDNYFICDLEDYDLIKQYSWKRNKDGYWICHKNNKISMLHRILLKINDKNIFVDHINHNKNDNRKINLRICTSQENNRNTKLQERNNSNIIGVRWNKNKQKWTSQIGLNYKIKYLGTFSTKEEAIIARLKAEKEIYKDFSPQKYLFDKYLI